MKKEDIQKQRYQTIVKSNDLIEKSRFELSLQQQKVMLYIISKINPFDENFKLYEFNIREFCAVCGMDINSGNNYYELRRQIENIATKSIWTILPDGRDALLRWIEKAYIDKRRGIVQIKLDDDLKPYLLQLNSNFTQYELIYVLRFKSKYSVRLYEYIKSVHYDELHSYTFEIDLEELRQRLDATEIHRAFKNFHMRILKPSVKEINSSSDKTIEYETISKGNKVVAIRFTITTKDTCERLKISCETEKELDGQINGQITIFDDEGITENE